jgi:hypothetical protein
VQVFATDVLISLATTIDKASPPAWSPCARGTPDARRYLHFVAGEPTANITRVILPALQIELRTALFRAAQRKENVKCAQDPCGSGA